MQEKTLATLLRDRRLQLKETVREIADRLGVTPMYVSYVERGEQVPQQPERLRALAEAYRISMGEVLSAVITSRAVKGTVELPTQGQDAAHADAAVVLARAWLDLTTEQIQRIRRIAEGGTDGAA